MSKLESRIKDYRNGLLKEQSNDNMLQMTIGESKAAFAEHEGLSTLSYMEFIYQQGRYIRKHWWMLQGILLLVLWFVIRFSGSELYIQRSMGLLAPLFAVMIVPELWKNRSCAAYEVECTSFYSLRQIYAARLILFAIADMLLLSAFFAWVSISGILGFDKIMIDFFIPFNVTCCICFGTLCSSRFGSEYLTLFLSSAWTAVWLLIVLNERIYSSIAIPIWIGLFILSILYMTFSIRKALNLCEAICEVNRYGVEN